MSSRILRVNSNVCVFEDKLYRWRRNTESLAPIINQLQVFDFHTGQSYAQPVKATMGSSYPVAVRYSASTSIGSSMYIFGGSRGRYYNDLLKINLRTYQLEEIVPTNRREAPIPKELCGMVAIGTTKLLVFGGLGGGRESNQPGASYIPVVPGGSATNETHLFDLEARQWSNIEVVGTRPPPCFSFSFTRVDLDRIILFGGCHVDYHDFTLANDIYILDTRNWTCGPLFRRICIPVVHGHKDACYIAPCH